MFQHKALLHQLRLALVSLIFALPFLLPYLLLLSPPKAQQSFLANPIYTGIQSIVARVENNIRDELMKQGRRATFDERLVLILVDSQSWLLDSYNPDQIEKSPVLTLMKKGWPWDRSIYKDILDTLFHHQAKAVGIDLLFLNPTPSDPAFSQAVNQYRKQVVLGANFVVSDGPYGTTKSLNTPSDTIIPDTNPLDDRIGYVNFFPDYQIDSLIRKVQYHALLGITTDSMVRSFGAALLQKAGYHEFVPPDSTARYFRFAGPPNTYQPMPIHELFNPNLSNWQKRIRSGYLKDKIIVIGPEGNWSQDQHPTPLGLMPGPEIHMNALAAALNNEFIHEAPNWVDALNLILAVALAWILGLFIRNPLIRLLVISLIVILYIALLTYLYNQANLFISSFPPIAAFAPAAIVNLTIDFVVEQIERRRLRGTFERYVSKNVVQYLIDNPQDLGGLRKPVTILFSDVRSFTTISEGMDSHDLVTQLNEYLSRMVACVFRNHGSLDKFIGDAVMAVWGNAITHGPKQDALNAIQSARQMQAELRKLNSEWKAQGRREWAIGIGINHGEVIVGNMGSPERMEFTVIGDPVNLASRLEGLTKEFHRELLIGESVADLIADCYTLRSVALVTVKGKTKPVEIFEVIEEKSKAVPEPTAQLLATYQKGIELYRNRSFREASLQFEQCLKTHPEDYLADLYLEDCKRLMAEPPPESWNGVVVMKTK